MIIIKANKGKYGGTHDKVMTPPEVAKRIIDWLPIMPTDKLLDAAAGEGAFYRNFPFENSFDICEIDMGTDFFHYTQKVDWIITNPPYSIFDAFLEHAFKIADNVCFLCPLSKFVSSMGRIKKYTNYGGVPKILIISASKCGFPFGFPCAAIWFKRGFKGKTKIDID